MYLRVNLLGPGRHLIKKKLPARGLTKVEKHCCRRLLSNVRHIWSIFGAAEQWL